MKRRDYCLTVYPNEEFGDTEFQQAVLDCQYAIRGIEVCPSTGRVHLQCYIYYKNPRSFKKVKSKFPGAHIEPAVGGVSKNVEYCSKDGDVWEWGEKPLSSSKKGVAESERWKRAKIAAQNGDLDSIDADIYIRLYSNLKKIVADNCVPSVVLERPCGVWLWGKSGYGKSFVCREFWPVHYPKMCNKWWDGYSNEAIVVMDDVDMGHSCLGHHLKIWADSYPFIGEIKGICRKLRPALFVVTSQYRIEDIWQDQHTRDALNRRFDVIEFREQNQVPLELCCYRVIGNEEEVADQLVNSESELRL